jgi:hypothetical protein
MRYKIVQSDGFILKEFSDGVVSGFHEIFV